GRGRHVAAGRSGERQHVSRLADVLEPLGDLLLLQAQAFRCEHGGGVDFSVRPQALHEVGQPGVARGTWLAVGEMLGQRRIERFAGTVREITVQQSFVAEVVRASDHGLPPKRPRSLRAARKRWTRTVDSFNPVIALTSRGVHSPKWHNMNTV